MLDTVTEGPNQGDGTPENSLDEFKELYLEQRAQQSRLRHVQQFLTSPVFYDLRLPEMQLTDPPEALATRKREVEYRISVLSSLLAMMQEERVFLDRTLPLDAAGSEASEDDVNDV